jgi:hypothetical protein
MTDQEETVRTPLTCGHYRYGFWRGMVWCDECRDFSSVGLRSEGTDTDD